MELYKLEAPILDIGRKVGFTDYIDFIRLKDVRYPFMKGTDVFRRKFIVVKMIVNDEVIIMETYFQRYTDNRNRWMACGHATRHSLLNTVGTGLISEQIELLKKIISGESVKIEEKHNTDFSNFIGDYVRLYDEREEAAKVIQKYWRECRYNPKYKMCQKIQYDGLVDICSN